MSKGIKKVASIALPIAGAVLGSFVGMPQVGAAIGGAAGGALSGGGFKGAALGAVGGYTGAGGFGALGGFAPAIGGAVSGYGSGGVEGALLGGISGYAAGSLKPGGGGITDSIIGTPAGTPLVGAPGPTVGSGLQGAMTGGGVRALVSSPTAAGAAASGVAGAVDPKKIIGGLTLVGNQVVGEANAEAATEAAKIQSQSIDKALATQSPYTELGASAARQIQEIQSDPGGYVKNNPFYASLADDAERRLLANQASKGKVGSGGTANELQTQLLNLGNGLVSQQIGTLQNQVNTGANAAGTYSGLQTDQGDVNAAGVIGNQGAKASTYDAQIKTLLAMQGLNKAPVYSPTLNL